LARYFFHLRDHTEESLDPDGSELPDLSAVIAAALFQARDTLSHELRKGVLDLRFRIDVEDETGALVHSLPLHEAFQVVTA
jgi:hypothetical protein